eukprot:132133-Rhodomonas_salina.2
MMLQASYGYEVSGTDMGYAATRYPIVLRMRYAVSGTEAGHAATRRVCGVAHERGPQGQVEEPQEVQVYLTVTPNMGRYNRHGNYDGGCAP